MYCFISILGRSNELLGDGTSAPLAPLMVRKGYRASTAILYRWGFNICTCTYLVPTCRCNSVLQCSAHSSTHSSTHVNTPSLRVVPGSVIPGLSLVWSMDGPWWKPVTYFTLLQYLGLRSSSSRSIGHFLQVSTMTEVSGRCDRFFPLDHSCETSLIESNDLNCLMLLWGKVCEDAMWELGLHYRKPNWRMGENDESICGNVSRHSRPSPLF